MGRVYRYGSASCELVLDARYMPIYITCWRGKPTVEAAKWHAEQVDELIAEVDAEYPRVLPIDCATLCDRPGADVRRYFAERLGNIPQRTIDAVIENYAVIPNAMLRGALTAIGWLNERAKAIKSVATFDAALTGAFATLDANGIQRPDGLGLDYLSPGAMSWVERNTA